MSQEAVAFVVERLLIDRDFRIRFAVVPLDTLLGVQCEGFDLTDDETVSLVQADIRMWCWPDEKEELTMVRAALVAVQQRRRR